MDVDPRLREIDDCLYRISTKAIIIKNQRILLVCEEGDEWWSLPGGGVDYGETPEEALLRELSEELGVEQQSLKTDNKIVFTTMGTVVGGVPRANFYYRVEVPASKITQTKHVRKSGWFSIGELPNLYLSPSTDTIVERLKGLL